MSQFVQKKKKKNKLKNVIKENDETPSTSLLEQLSFSMTSILVCPC